MDRDEILAYIYDSGTVQKVVRKLSSYLKPSDTEDFVQEILLAVCELPEEKLLDLWSQGSQSLLNYVASMTLYSVTNASGRLGRKYGYDLKGRGVTLLPLENIREPRDAGEE